MQTDLIQQAPRRSTRSKRPPRRLVVVHGLDENGREIETYDEEEVVINDYTYLDGSSDSEDEVGWSNPDQEEDVQFEPGSEDEDPDISDLEEEEDLDMQQDLADLQRGWDVDDEAELEADDDSDVIDLCDSFPDEEEEEDDGDLSSVIMSDASDE